jgi:hypothetical protein
MSLSFYKKKQGNKNQETARKTATDFEDISRLRFAHKESSKGVAQLSGADSQTFAGIRSCRCAASPTGPAPTGSPRLRRGFGHLLAMITSRNPAPSRDAAAGSAKMFGVLKISLATTGGFG